jgi:hypothetical protein
MAKINEVQSIIIAAASANLTAHTYSEVYGGSLGCTIVLNGVTVSMGSSSSIFININTISGGTGCFLLGVKKDVIEGSTDYL